MPIARLSDFRKDIKRYLNRVTKNYETTQYELSSRVNEARLDSAIEKLRKGSSFQKELIAESHRSLTLKWLPGD